MTLESKTTEIIKLPKLDFKLKAFLEASNQTRKVNQVVNDLEIKIEVPQQQTEIPDFYKYSNEIQNTDYDYADKKKNSDSKIKDVYCYEGLLKAAEQIENIINNYVKDKDVELDMEKVNKAFDDTIPKVYDRVAKGPHLYKNDGKPFEIEEECFKRYRTAIGSYATSVVNKFKEDLIAAIKIRTTQRDLQAKLKAAEQLNADLSDMKFAAIE